MSETKPSIKRPVLPPPLPRTDRSMPPQPPTTKLPAVQVPQSTLDAVLGEVRAMRMETGDKFIEVSTRLSKMDNRIDDLERRQTSNSVRVRGTSENDLKQDAAIAGILTKVSGLERSQGEQTAKLVGLTMSMATNNADTSAIRRELVDGVKSFWARNPKLETAFVGLLMAAFTLATAWIAGRF